MRFSPRVDGQDPAPGVLAGPELNQLIGHNAEGGSLLRAVPGFPLVAAQPQPGALLAARVALVAAGDAVAQHGQPTVAEGGNARAVPPWLAFAVSSERLTEGPLGRPRASPVLGRGESDAGVASIAVVGAFSEDADQPARWRERQVGEGLVDAVVSTDNVFFNHRNLPGCIGLGEAALQVYGPGMVETTDPTVPPAPTPPVGSCGGPRGCCCRPLGRLLRRPPG